MALRTITLAVISDLHCHPKRKKEEGPDETYLLTDKLRSPASDHPVESLLKIIHHNNLKVDITLCPGDFTDKANIQGFIAGWNYSLEISRELKSDEVIATLGNHDVDAYNNYSNYSLETAKGIKQGFPFLGDNECNSFWANGCVFLERDTLRILVINSSHYHYNKASSKSGKISKDIIDYIREYLSQYNDDKIKIAMSHHHPIDHSRLQLGEEDKLINGSDLLDTLGDFDFDLFIHGHKHDALLRNHKTQTNTLPIFASGSFSSSSNLMFTSVRNLFHVITITKDIKSKGEIQTWTFFPNDGWRQNYDERSFAPFTGFGSEESPEKLCDQIRVLMNNKHQETWDNVTSTIPEINNLIPEDSNILYNLLRKENYITDKHLWQKPSLIFNSNYRPNEK